MSDVAGADGLARPSPKLDWAGYALGFGLGGFFDGILLHQILQWHHLLSGLEGARADLRLLILTDGLFHLLMYLVVGVGLWLLWQVRREAGRPGADRRLFADALIGFGAWHLLDAVLSHWILGIHRIRMDVDDPLLWDLLWLGLFGIIPLVAGILMRRTGPSQGRRLLSSPLALVLAVALAGPWAALPSPRTDNMVMVVFRPGVTPAEAMAGVAASGGSLVWSDSSDQIWAVALPEGHAPGALYGHGALLVSNSILPAGCLDWTRT